jgi:hypothetical protein
MPASNPDLAMIRRMLDVVSGPFLSEQKRYGVSG